MRIHVLSDLHLEFWPFEWPDVDADVAVLAGDIGVGLGGLELAMRHPKKIPVIYVAGNHEFYGRDLLDLHPRLKADAARHGVHFLENEAVVLDGVRFLGATLWTDFRLFGADKLDEAKLLARLMMNDYRRIELGPRKVLSPDDTIRFHEASVEWLTGELAAPFSGPTVVVTHHAPSPRSVSEEWLREPVSAAFASDLSHLMGRDRVRLWIHGHTHYPIGYEVAGTQVIANQRGYPKEAIVGYDPRKVVEVR